MLIRHVLLSLLFISQISLFLCAKKAPAPVKCFEYPLTETEENVLQDIRSRIERKETIPKECLFSLASRGYFEAATVIYQQVFLLKENEDTKTMQNELKNHLTGMRRDLDNLVNVLVSSNPNEIPTSTPIYAWAQSRDHILIMVKFAHRMDSPSCVNIKSEVVKFDNNSFSLEALCITGHKPLKYELNLTLAKEINVEKTHWTKEIGVFQFNISKNETGTLWRNVLADGSKVPIWFEMKKFVARDMEDYFRMLEDEVKEKEKEEEEKKKASKKKKKKSKKEREEEEEERERQERREREEREENENNQEE